MFSTPSQEVEIRLTVSLPPKAVVGCGLNRAVDVVKIAIAPIPVFCFFLNSTFSCINQQGFFLFFSHILSSSTLFEGAEYVHVQ